VSAVDASENADLMVAAAELAQDMNEERHEAEDQQKALSTPNPPRVPSPRRLSRHGRWKTSLPDGSTASKRTILRHLCEAYSAGRTDLHRLPKERRMKIISIARQERQDETFRTSRAKADGTPETVEIELEVVRPFTAVAIAIAATDGNNTVGYGQVQKVKLDGKSMKDGVQTDDERVLEVVLTVTWFKRTGKGFHLTDSLPSKDNLHHPMSTYLGNVDFAFDPETSLYTFRYLSLRSHLVRIFVPAYFVPSFLQAFIFLLCQQPFIFYCAYSLYTSRS
jgi:hypothetical protein